jgi:outer membrane receptor protein involved in Fe transport
VGTSVNYGHNGITFTLGGAFQSLILDATCETKPQAIEKLNKPYYSFIPYFQTYLELPKNMHFNASYSYSVKEPDISYLFPMPDLSNTMYKILGNTDLEPERFHQMDASYNIWNNASMFSFRISGGAKLFTNQIVYNQSINFVENQGFVTTSIPDNVKGGNEFSSSIWTSFPIVKTIFTMSLAASGNLSNSPVFINEEKNNTNSKGYRGNIYFNINAKQRLTFTLSGNMSQTFTKYDKQTDRNQSYINCGAYFNAKWQVFKKTYLEGSYSFSCYLNKKPEFVDQYLHRLNLSVRQVIGKKNQWELRAAAIDILNQNEYISQIARLNYIEYRTAPTIARYFMLTVSYNIKGFEVKNTDGGRRVMMRH